MNDRYRYLRESCRFDEEYGRGFWTGMLIARAKPEDRHEINGVINESRFLAHDYWKRHKEHRYATA